MFSTGSSAGSAVSTTCPFSTGWTSLISLAQRKEQKTWSWTEALQQWAEKASTQAFTLRNVCIKHGKKILHEFTSAETYISCTSTEACTVYCSTNKFYLPYCSEGITSSCKPSCIGLKLKKNLNSFPNLKLLFDIFKVPFRAGEKWCIVLWNGYNAQHDTFPFKDIKHRILYLKQIYVLKSCL